MIDVKDAMSSLLHDLGYLLLGDEFLNGEFTRKDGNEIGDRVRLQEAVDGRRKLVKSCLLPPCSVGDGLDFWEVDRNVVFPKVKYPGDHAEGGQRVQGCSLIVPFTGTSENDGDIRVDGRHGGRV